MIKLIRFSLAFLLLTNCCFLFCQDLKYHQKHILDSLIYADHLEKAEELLNELNGKSKDNSVDELWLITRAINVCDRMQDSIRGINLRKQFVENLYSIPVYNQPERINIYNADSVKYAMAQANMPRHLRGLAEYFVLNGNYDLALKCLNQQRAFYPFDQSCGVGIVYEHREYIELASVIHYNLSNYDTVEALLLPLNFSNVYAIYTPSYEDGINLDSILYLSLRRKYTDDEIRSELNQCIARTLNERPSMDTPEDGFTLLMFGKLITTSDPVIRFNSKTRQLMSNEKINSQQTSAEIEKRSYDLAVRESILNMRLYKDLE